MADKMAAVKDLQIGRQYLGLYVLQNVSVSQKKSGESYLRLTLSDATGEVHGNMWNMPENADALSAGILVKASFSVQEYNGQKQINASALTPVEVERVPREYLSQVLPVSPIDPQLLYNELHETAEGFQNRQLSAVCVRALDENKEAVMTIPAAKSVHEACIGGLAYHETMMLRSAKALASVYTNIDAELLEAGVILHDIGKIREFTIGPLGLVTDYSVEGNLLGHLYLGAKYVGDLCRELHVDEETSLLLQHMIASHHGQREYGAIQPPCIAEAEMLYLIDTMDAAVWQFEEAEAKTAPGTMSAKVFGLDTRVYARKKKN